ncbi:GGDEF domain-containing protein [Bradyrhizobium japonicum]|uniref:GGDEF domain-containing protein n=1 Tax=Bradyrhizobium japonicum TaxID=375 RepID=UPI00057D8212|nr:GGDEF domain-containing protein [Bradyrhizobium japonicum]MCD9108279.1 GGDEF domain-containing protein [Bradyrhizobium japonicum]MCD9256299.1 GGDEF domain-containing protein [Bradyrhizobium japonicum SEMIA 5079]MCD9822086.1 GGDEF domain-containing protein [Bradyrhizobium japonicum]MCD9894105.1 GGDEF domain-containing protein [Bradyrhizobium japonicum]MCD9906607.1 GGDEF domain-containing protein [Bradyrhizobium japonicum]
MQSDEGLYSAPRWRLTRWLAEPGPGVPDDIRAALIAQLHGSLPVFAAGAVNTIAVAAVIAARKPTAPFILWLVMEIVICLARLLVLASAHRRAREHRPTPTDLHLLLAVAWSASVGFGAIVSLASGDWVVAMLASLSAAAMVGGICFRNFGAPRLAGTMILLSLGPIIPGAALAGEPLFYTVYLQVPMYLAAMTAAAFRLNRMLVTTMRAERENSHRAHHDALTGLLNRAGFVEALGARLGADAERPFAVMFFDLDNFKPINDTFGHAAGDAVLKAVAGRVRRALPDGAVVARMGGDEFVALVDGLTPDMALEMGHRLISEVAISYELGGEVRASVGASVGIAMSPDHGAEVEELLGVADAALYEAKSGGKSRCCLASVETNLVALRRLQQSGPKGPIASAA